MATWIILAAVLLVVLIIGGALLIVVVATGEKARKFKLPRVRGRRTGGSDQQP